MSWLNSSRLIQNFAPSPPVPAHSPTLTTMAPMKIAAYVSSRGRTAQWFISSITLSVIRLMVSRDTEAP